ncbi:MAG: GH32 C-terminal domain-containing protein [Bacteroidales bacterium]
MVRILILLFLLVVAKESKTQSTEGEKFRPSFHYTPQKNRIGKLSGLVKLDDTYFLYFQKNMRNIEDAYYSLCQISSKDLINWSDEQEVVRPGVQNEKLKETIYTGSAIVDNNKRSSMSSENPAILLYYTKLGEGVCMSYSNDKGQTWQEFADNPIIPEKENERIEHPYVFFDREGSNWYMSLSVVDNETKKRSLRILSTSNLTDFENAYNSDITCDKASILSYVKSDNSIGWILINDNGSYQPIELDGSDIVTSGSLKWSDNGRSSSSPTFCEDAGVYKSLSLMDGNFLGMPFRGQLSLPVNINLQDRGADVIMSQRPIDELSQLVSDTKEIKDKLVMPGGKNVFSGVKGVQLRIKGSVEMRSCNYFTIYTRVYRDMSLAQIVYEFENQKIVSSGNSADCPLPANKIVDFDIVIDKTSMEVFANKGEAVLKSLVISEEEKATDFIVTAKGGEAYIQSLLIMDISNNEQVRDK